MPTILEQLRAQAKAEDHDARNFAMLNCASFLKDTQIEGNTHRNALNYFKKIISATNNACSDLTEEQKALSLRSMENLEFFSDLYPTCLADPKNPASAIDIDKLLGEIKKQCEQTGSCYLPSGWLSAKEGHYLSAKVTRQADGRYDICFLNHGAGSNHHAVLGTSAHKSKYDYRSHTYRMDLDSDSAKLFFHGFLQLVLGTYASFGCDAQDLYGLLALHGELQQYPAEAKRQVTTQRSGTCALTNTRVAVKDTLLYDAKMSQTQTKRYEFFNKLASIVTAYTHLLAHEEAQKSDHELQLLTLALRELYVRMEKLHPKGLSDDELSEIRRYADEINAKVEQCKVNVLQNDCEIKPLPQVYRCSWVAEPLKTESDSAEPAKLEPKLELSCPPIETCKPNELKEYLKKHLLYHSKVEQSPDTNYQFDQLMSSLAPTTAADNDPYWDDVPVEDLSEIIRSFAELFRRPIYLKDNEYKKLALIAYDIAAQIAPRIPDLNLGSEYTLGLDDVYSADSRYEDPATVLTISKLSEQFRVRAQSKKLLFTNAMELDKKVVDYIYSLLTDQIKDSISKEIFRGLFLTNKEWATLFLTGRLEDLGKSIEISKYLPDLANILFLAARAQARVNQYAQYRNTLCFDPIGYSERREFSDRFAANSEPSPNPNIQQIRQIIPYNLIPQNQGDYRDFVENAIFQPESMRVSKTRQPDKLRFPWSMNRDGDFKSGEVLEEYGLEAANDENLKRLQVDRGFEFQRALIWMEHNTSALFGGNLWIWKVRSNLSHRLFDYGAIYSALVNAPNETHQQMKKTLAKLYEVCDTVVLSNSDSAVETFALVCKLESAYRNWLVSMDKQELMVDELPSCQSRLQAILGSVPKQEQPMVAEALLMNLSTVKPLSDEDLKYLLASRLIIMQLTVSQRFHYQGVLDTHQGSESWSLLKNELKTRLELMDSAPRSQLIQDVLKIMGHQTLAQEHPHWEYSAPFISAKNANLTINLDTGQMRVDGCPLINRNLELLGSMKLISEKLGWDATKLQFTSIPPSAEFTGCTIQTEAPDGIRYFIESPNYNQIRSLKKHALIDHARYLWELVADLYSYSQPQDLSGKLLSALKLANPFSGSKTTMLWQNRESHSLLIESGKNPNKAYYSDAKGGWHRLTKTARGWQRDGNVVLNPLDLSNPIVNEWSASLSRFCNPSQIKYKARLNQDRTELELMAIKIPQLALNFTAKNNKLYSREYPGYFLSGKQSIPELNGLSSLIVLENEQGDTRFLLPRASLLKQSDTIYTKNPLRHDASSYMVIEKTKKGFIKAKTAEDNLRLALIYAMQGDYPRAMHSLELSTSYQANTPELATMLIKFSEVLPNTPSAYAFYWHAYKRYQYHKEKWTKSTTSVSKEIEKQLQKEAIQHFLNYKGTISAQREGVDIIPSCLMPIPEINSLPSDEDTSEEGTKTRAFKDPAFEKTNLVVSLKLNLKEESVLVNHKKQGNLPFYPPLKVAADKRYTEGVDARGSTWQGIDMDIGYINTYFVDFFLLAISDNPVDTERLNSYLFHFVHSSTSKSNKINQRIAILRYVNQHKELFRDIVHDNTTAHLLAAIYKILKNNPSLQNSELFSDLSESPEPNEMDKAAHWLQGASHSVFSLASFNLPADSKRPLGKSLKLFFNDTQSTVAVAELTPHLDASQTQNLSPIAKRIIHNYQLGFEKNLKRSQHHYSLKNKSPELLAKHMAELAAKQKAQADSLSQTILSLANQLPEDKPEHRVTCELIKSSRKSGKRPSIDMGVIIECLLSNDTSPLHQSNPFLSQAQVNELLSSTCTYMLSQSKEAQCKDVIAVLKEYAHLDPLPQWVQQLLGETLAKERSYLPQEYPELLIYEYATGWMLREGQAEKIIELIQIIESNQQGSETYRHALLQFAAGGGKTEVLIRILVHRFARKGFLPIIFNTSELYSIAIQEIPDRLKEIFNQNIEVIERELDYNWGSDELAKLLEDLQLWKFEKKCLLLKSVTWHSIDLAYKAALDEGRLETAEQAKMVLDFFATQCIKIEDEGHLISDPTQESIRTDMPTESFSMEQNGLILDFYHQLMGQAPSNQRLSVLSGMTEQSKKSITAAELSELKTLLTDIALGHPLFTSLDADLFKTYLLSESSQRPLWLLNLRRDNPQLAELVVLSRSFIQTHLPHILTLQYKKNYGTSIHPNDLTAAPKHDGHDVASHFSDPVLVLALTTQMTMQHGVPVDYVERIFSTLCAAHKAQKKSSPNLTQAELQIIKLLPEKYRLCSIESLDLSELSGDKEVRFCPALVDHFLKTYAYPQIKMPKKLYQSTPADLQAGFNASIIFTATPGLPETYPVQLAAKNILLANEFEAEVISTLLGEKNAQGVLIDQFTNASEFFAELKKADTQQFEKMTALIDRGALLSNLESQQIAEALQSILKEEDANTLYFSDNAMELGSKSKLKSTRLKGTRIIEALREQGFTLEQVMVFLFLDLAHTTGTDVRRPYQDRAALTVGKEQTLTDTIQAAMRERQLLREDAQTIVWVLFKSLHQQINPQNPQFDLNQVFLWMVHNQARRDEHKVLMRAYQGLNQLITRFALEKYNSGERKLEEIKDILSKQTSLSIWDIYEVENSKDNAGKVLHDYIDAFCVRCHVDPKQFPPAMQQQVQRIVEETQQLITKLYQPRDQELSGEVVHEQLQEQEQEVQQEQQQDHTLLNRYNQQSSGKLMLEVYTKEDELDAIFAHKNPQYRSFALPGCQDIALPQFVINPLHFAPMQNMNEQGLDFLKPLETLIIQRLPDGTMHYLACTLAGAKYFREQIKARAFTEQDASYLMIDHHGVPLYQSSNCPEGFLAQCKEMEQYTDLLCFVELIHGRMSNPENTKAFIARHKIDQQAFKAIVSAVKKIHVDSKPVELDDLPYFEYLCGWRELDETVQKRLAYKTMMPAAEIDVDQVPTRTTTTESHAKAKREEIGYIPETLAPVLPPFVLGLPTTTPHLRLVPEGRGEVQVKRSHDDDNAEPKAQATYSGAGLFSPPPVKSKDTPPVKEPESVADGAMSSDLLLGEINQAIDKYIKYHSTKIRAEKRQTSRGKAGFFSSWRHTHKGIDTANDLKVSLNELSDLVQIKEELSHFFGHKKTRYHRHSLASYVLDGISKALRDSGHDPLPVDKDNKYTKQAWTEELIPSPKR